MNKFRAVLFDMDGLLIDSERVYLDAWVMAAEAMGCFDTRDFFVSLIGVGFGDCLPLLRTKFGDAFDLERLLALNADLVASLMAERLTIRPGVEELLECLDQAGLPRGVVTSSGRQTASSCLAQVDIHGRFDFVVTREAAARGKPHPDLYQEALTRFGVPAKACVAIEDTYIGARAALAAGLPTIMVPDLVPAPPQAHDHCLMVAESLLDLIGLFRG